MSEFENHLDGLRHHVSTYGISDEFVMKMVSDDAKIVAGGIFGPMPVGRGELRFGMRENRPSDRMAAALAELVAAGAIDRKDDPDGAIAYVPQLNLQIFFSWAGRNTHRDDLRFNVVEPIVPSSIPMGTTQKYEPIESPFLPRTASDPGA